MKYREKGDSAARFVVSKMLQNPDIVLHKVKDPSGTPDTTG